MKQAFVFFMILFFAFQSCKTSSVLKPADEGHFLVSCPKYIDNPAKIKKYILSVDQSDKRLLKVYEKICSGIFSDAISRLHLKKSAVEPMFAWMNFCEGLKENLGATALTHGYRNQNGYNLVLLIDSSFIESDASVLAGLVTHEMIHAYCDHLNLPAGESFHEQWFDVIASKIEELSFESIYRSHFFSCLHHIFRE